MLGHMGGTAGEDEPGSGVAAMVTSSAGGWGPNVATTCLVGKGGRPATARVLIQPSWGLRGRYNGYKWMLG
jgi:hypothetical protein